MAYLFQSGSVNVQLSGGMNLHYSDVTSDKRVIIDADGTARNGDAGSLLFGENQEAGMWYTGSEGNSSFARDIESGGRHSFLVDNSPQVEIDASGLDLASGNALSIAGTKYLDSGTLSTAVTGSALTSLGTIASLVATTADINAGTVDNATIGATTPEAGTFTALECTTLVMPDVTSGKLLVADGSDYEEVALSGDATLASTGALTIAADAVTFAKMQDVAANSVLVRDANSSGVLSELALATTEIMIGDGTGFAAAALSGDVTMDNAGAVTIAAAAVESGMLNNNVISGQTELAVDGLVAADEFMISDGGTLKKIGVDNLFTDGPGLLTAATIVVADDHFMFLDGGATGNAKTESIVDLMSAVAGSGITATNGVLSVSAAGGSINGIGDEADDLDEGMNYGTTKLTQDRTWTLLQANAMSNLDAGDIVRIKAPQLDGFTLTIAVNAADQVDDLAVGVDLLLNSDNASITLQCVDAATAGKWRII